MSATRTILRRALLTSTKRISPSSATSFATRRAQFQPIVNQISQPRHFSATKMSKQGVHNLASYVQPTSIRAQILRSEKDS